MRRLLIAATLVAALAIGGCGSSSDDDGGGSGADGGKTKVTFWHGQNDLTQRAYERLVDQFNATHPDIEVDANSGGVLADEMLTKLTAGLAGGSYPDVAYVFGSDLANIARSDKVQDLTDAVADPAWRWNDFFAGERDARDGRRQSPRGSGAGRQPRHHLQQETVRRRGRPGAGRRLDVGRTSAPSPSS